MNDDRQFIKSENALQLDCIETLLVFQSCNFTFTENIDIELKCNETLVAEEVECQEIAICTNKVKIDNKVPVLDCKVDCIEGKIITGTEFTIIIRVKLLPKGKIIQRKHKVIVPKKNMFTLTRAGEPGLKCQVEIFAECLKCSIARTDCENKVEKIRCCVGILLVAKLYSEVELLVPSFGYCFLPLECEVPVSKCRSDKPQKVPKSAPTFPPKDTCPSPTCNPTDQTTSIKLPPINCQIVEPDYFYNKVQDNCNKHKLSLSYEKSTKNTISSFDEEGNLVIIFPPVTIED